MSIEIIDTLGDGALSVRIEYEGYHGCKVFATARLFESDHRCPVIVVTDESETHQGTSLTNTVETAMCLAWVSETAMYLAWVSFGMPWPCTFAEHYRGSDHRDESLDVVRFDSVDDDAPVVVEDHRGLSRFRLPQWRGSTLDPAEHLASLMRPRGHQSQ